jgi:hypothetical protein
MRLAAEGGGWAGEAGWCVVKREREREREKEREREY